MEIGFPPNAQIGQSAKKDRRRRFPHDAVAGGERFAGHSVGDYRATRPRTRGLRPQQRLGTAVRGVGTPYVVPGDGTITSWSHSAGAGAGQTMTMKIWRQVVAGTTYTAVGHDGPRALAPSAINTFSANIPVKPGDLLGFHSGAVPPAACLSALTPGDTLLGRFGDAADGEPADFTPFSRHLNITAVFEPAKPEPAKPGPPSPATRSPSARSGATRRRARRPSP